jgi:hypothetical protein
MTNLYCDRDTFKTRMSITGTADDAALLVLLEHVSRAIDQWCNRFFFVLPETRYFNGSKSPLMLDADLTAITTLKTDDNQDGTAETTWATTDYVILPLNGSPKYALAVTPWGAKRTFLPGQLRAIEIAGKWGYQDDQEAGPLSNEGAPFTAADLTLTVSDGTKVKVGETFRLEDEQLFITAISGNNLTVQRGVNGTTAASHADQATLQMYRYPLPVAEACILLAGRAWRRKDLQFVVNPIDRAGGALPLAEVDPEARVLLAPFRRLPLAAV